ncbi:MAG: hypothetical protein M0T77_08145 [Actinomycetota bacterium]|nr:hypothetical protein [Actinomycetota bacterium]
MSRFVVAHRASSVSFLAHTCSSEKAAPRLFGLESSLLVPDVPVFLPIAQAGAPAVRGKLLIMLMPVLKMRCRAVVVAEFLKFFQISEVLVVIVGVVERLARDCLIIFERGDA